MSFFKKLFGKGENPEPREFTEQEHELNYEQKKEALEHVLGPMHELVGHAIIPFEVGGAVDMYYFPHHIEGTGFATMELLDPDGKGPKPNRLGTYELLAFTKHAYNDSEDTQTPFNLAERKACGILTAIGSFSQQAKLNPGETCEIPNDEGEENTCLVFDLYQPGAETFKIGNRQHHLLLCLQVFRSEMEFARENGSDKLLKLLKDAGHYPYSDLDRQPVA
jgi:hypothetical protein